MTGRQALPGGLLAAMICQSGEDHNERCVEAQLQRRIPRDSRPGQYRAMAKRASNPPLMVAGELACVQPALGA
jgi:hypothetical protein